MSRSDDTTATEADATPALNNTNDQLVTASASGVSDTETATLETGISPGSQIKPLCNMTTPATNVRALAHKNIGDFIDIFYIDG